MWPGNGYVEILSNYLYFEYKKSNRPYHAEGLIDPKVLAKKT
jgi:hypothetical protein